MLMKNFLSGFGLSTFTAFYLLCNLFTSCTHEPDLEGFETVCFDTEVLPVLQTSCGMTGCHDGTEDGFLAADYASVMESVTPGDPRKSMLYKIITDIHSHDMMPPDKPLSQSQRNIIQVWIAQGAQETLCETDTGGNQADRICFVQDILPMMLSSCGVTGCHDAITAEHGHVFTDYNSILEHGIEPFDPDNSEIYEVVTETGGDRMPPSPRNPLTLEQISALRKWIEDGALNSDCPADICDTAGTISFSTQIFPVLQANCAGCHNSSIANGNVNLSSYNQVLTQVQTLRNGTPVLSGVVNRTTGFVAMPLTFSLQDCDITAIEKWIAQGAMNN
jgi:hypothetical protein